MPREIVLNVPSVREAFSKVRQHVVDHKEIYLVGGVCLVAGVVYGRNTAESYPIETFTPEIEGNSNVVSEIIEIEGDNNEIGNTHIHNTNIVTMGGHTRKIVQNLDTGEIFGSATEAADHAGVSRQLMSHHLNGRKDHVSGEHYKIIGLTTE